jgi:hypothetical protein
VEIERAATRNGGSSLVQGYVFSARVIARAIPAPPATEGSMGFA